MPDFFLETFWIWAAWNEATTLILRSQKCCAKDPGRGAEPAVCRFGKVVEMEKYKQRQIQEAADMAVLKCGDQMNVTEYWVDGKVLSVSFEIVPLIKKVVTVRGEPQTVTLRYLIDSDGTMRRECLNLPRNAETFRIRNCIRDFTFEFASRLKESEKEGEKT